MFTFLYVTAAGAVGSMDIVGNVLGFGRSRHDGLRQHLIPSAVKIGNTFRAGPRSLRLAVPSTSFPQNGQKAGLEGLVFNAPVRRGLFRLLRPTHTTVTTSAASCCDAVLEVSFPVAVWIVFARLGPFCVVKLSTVSKFVTSYPCGIHHHRHYHDQPLIIIGISCLSLISATSPVYRASPTPTKWLP